MIRYPFPFGTVSSVALFRFSRNSSSAGSRRILPCKSFCSVSINFLGMSFPTRRTFGISQEPTIPPSYSSFPRVMRGSVAFSMASSSEFAKTKRKFRIPITRNNCFFVSMTVASFVLSYLAVPPEQNPNFLPNESRQLTASASLGAAQADKIPFPKPLSFLPARARLETQTLQIGCGARTRTWNFSSKGRRVTNCTTPQLL